MWLALLAGGALASFVAGRAGATGVPSSRPLRYAGTLLGPDERPLEGEHNISLTLSDTAEEDTTPLCQQSTSALALEHGRFSLELPDTCVDAVANNPDVWVEVWVDGQSFGKVKVSAVPFALEAAHATNADVARAFGGDGPLGLGRQWFSGRVVDGLLPEGSPFRFIGDPALTRVVDGVCPEGSTVVSGGGDAGEATGNYLRESRPVSDTSWRVACAGPAGEVSCASYNLVCARIGP